MPPSPAQEVEDLGNEIEKYRGLVSIANAKLEDLELAEALAGFTEVIDAQRAGRLSVATPIGHQILGQALTGRAITYANLGRVPDATSDFESLVRFDVAWPIDRNTISPKILELYDEVRGRLVGRLAVNTEPPGARLAVDGNPIGLTPMFPHELLAGQHTVTIEADGYQTIEERMTIGGGQQADLNIQLTANARSVLVTTVPVGATLTIDDTERGVTFGAAGPEYEEIAASIEVPLSDISAPLVVEHLSPGTHMLRISKECYEPQLVTVEVQVDPFRNDPIRLEPIRLTQSLGSLKVESDPPGARIVLDGEPAGETPAGLEDLCSGDHELMVKHPEAGQWMGRVTIGKGKSKLVEAVMRPTIAWVGMTVGGSGGAPPLGEKELGDALARLGGMNVVSPGAGLPETLRARAIETTQDGRLPQSYVDGVREETGADMVLAAWPGPGGFGRNVEIVVHATRYPVSDRLSVSMDETSAIDELLERLGTVPEMTVPWLGVSLIDLHRAENPVVVRVRPESPAAKAGVAVGDRLVSIGGAELERAADLVNIQAGLKPASQVSLMIQKPGASPSVRNAKVGTTLRMPPPEEPGRIDAVALALLSQRARLEAATGRSATPEGKAALLGLGTLLMHAGLHEQALDEAFGRLEMTETTGISRGTVDFLSGVCLQKTGRLLEARQRYVDAASQPEATILTNDGPPVADRARRYLGQLSTRSASFFLLTPTSHSPIF